MALSSQSRMTQPRHLFQDHDRLFASNRFVYPVLSRRAGGISVGVNLNPDKICNFDCIYCQVDRTRQSETRFVETDQLVEELDKMLSLVTSGEIFQSEKFRETPDSLRRLTDIALSGDGEPTTYDNFDQIIEACSEVKRRHELDDVKMVLISNATMFHREHVQRGLRILDENQGEIWAKLEFGTEAYYRLVTRASIPLERVLENITSAAMIRPIVIQSLFMRIDGEGPPDEELEAFCQRLSDLVGAGGKIKLVQIYTVARRPAESFVRPLSPSQVDALVELVRRRTGLEVVGYYGFE